MTFNTVILFSVAALCLASQASALKIGDEERSSARAFASERFKGVLTKRPPSALDSSIEPPFSFVYNGAPFNELCKAWKITRSRKVLDQARTQLTTTWLDAGTGLQVRCVAVAYEDYPTVEWTVYLSNTGKNDTPIIESLQAIDIGATGQKFLLHHNIGSPCQPNDYQPLETVLEPSSEKTISAAGGRPTNSDLCYFNLECGGGGVIMAIGWPGQWSASFTRDASRGLRIRAGQELTHFKLHPGEEVRTPLVALQFWNGDRIRSQNIWRRWMMAHSVPRAGGRPVGTHYASCFGTDLQPCASDEIAQIEGHVRERIKLDYWILDAGWYPDKGSWVNVGTWEPDTVRFPNGIREVADKAHAAGMKFVLWFEPERVRPGTWLYQNHPEWLLVSSDKNNDTRLLDLGNPGAWKWVTNHIDGMLKDQHIDVLRQDFNIDPLPYWRSSDAPDRQGITENHYVTGLLAFWDELLRRDPNRWIDTCASGGRRNDLETLRRAVPLLRSDYFERPVSQQCHTYGISLWMPVYGSGTGSKDLNLIRSSICPMWRIGLDFRGSDWDYDFLRRVVSQFRQIEPCLIGDFYPLTPYSQAEDVWMAWQFDLPDQARGAVQVFRRSECSADRMTLKLYGLDPAASYTVTDLDTNKPETRTGKSLMNEGLSVTISGKPGAAILTYQRDGA